MAVKTTLVLLIGDSPVDHVQNGLWVIRKGRSFTWLVPNIVPVWRMGCCSSVTMFRFGGVFDMVSTELVQETS